MGMLYAEKLVKKKKKKINGNLAISIITNHSNVVASISARCEQKLESYESQ